MIKTNIIEVNFYKTKRRNAKLCERLTYMYDKYDVLNSLYNIIDTYINQERQGNKYFKITYTYIIRADKGLAEFRLSNFNSQVERVYSIEQFINRVIPVLVMANAADNISNEELLNAHNNIIIRQLIKKYYRRDN